MSNADSEELVTATSDGVSVEKSFEPDDFPVPAIAFLLRSDRSETVTVRLVDTVPDHVPPEDIGFHPKYGAEFWDVEDGTIVFEREFEPDEEYTTVYGLRGGDADDAEKFMSEPRVESVDPPIDDGESGDVVRDVIGEDAEPSKDDIASAIDNIEADSDIDPEENGSRPASAADDSAGTVAADEEPTTMTDLDVEAGAGDDEEVETAVDLADTEVEPDPPDSATVGGIAADESLVAALAEEIRTADHDDEDLRTLRDAMDVDLASASVEARIEHLQSEVSDLGAYTDALEEFLDENGTAQAVITDLRTEFEETTERLDEVEATAEEAAETAATVEEELAELRDVLDDAVEDAHGISDNVESLRRDLEDLETEVGGETADRLEELESDVDELSQELSDVAEMRDRLASALGGLSGDSGEDGAD